MLKKIIFISVAGFGMGYYSSYAMEQERQEKPQKIKLYIKIDVIKERKRIDKKIEQLADESNLARMALHGFLKKCEEEVNKLMSVSLPQAENWHDLSLENTKKLYEILKKYSSLSKQAGIFEKDLDKKKKETLIIKIVKRIKDKWGWAPKVLMIKDEEYPDLYALSAEQLEKIYDILQYYTSANYFKMSGSSGAHSQTIDLFYNEIENTLPGIWEKEGGLFSLSLEQLEIFYNVLKKCFWWQVFE